MLEFASKHQIFPTVEQFSFEDFNKAYNHLLKGTPKYRCVVKV
jgi:D-arabinose 1-dehydrogenase-like Zn-dependent alcohol dehydrogenase